MDGDQEDHQEHHIMELAVVNPKPPKLRGPSRLHELVQQKHEHGEHQPAIDHLRAHGDRVSLSYQQLHAFSDVLATRITACFADTPVQESFVVPVLIPQSTQLYVSILGILKAGGALCPLNLDIPLERVKFILKDVSAKVVLAAPELSSQLPREEGMEIIIVTDSLYTDNMMPGPLAARIPSEDDLAYVMYTSGSTGTPKGVGVSHGAATQSLLAHQRHIPQFSRFLQFASPTFDVSMFEIFFPLFRGCTLVSCTRGLMLDDLPRVLVEMNVDACELTPTVAGSLLRTRENAPCLRLLLTIGEMLTEPVVREFGGCEDRESMLYAMYGPTEASIHW